MKILILIFFTAFLLSSCSNEQFDNCDNVTRNISWTDAKTTIDLNYSLSPLEFREIIDNSLDTIICREENYFGLKLSDDEIYKVYLKEKCDGVMYCFVILNPEIEILVNKPGQMLLEGEYTISDEILVWNKIGEDYQAWQKVGFRLKWDNDTPADTLNKIISNIKQKYLNEWEHCSQDIYSTSFCLLSEAQSDSICDSIPFKLKLDTYVFPIMAIPNEIPLKRNDLDTISS